MALRMFFVKFNVVENVNTTEPLSFVLNRIISPALSLSCYQSVHRVKDKSIRTLPVVPRCLGLYLCAGLSNSRLEFAAEAIKN